MKKREWTSETATAVRKATKLHDPVEGAILLGERFVEENGLPLAAGKLKLNLFASALDARIERVPMKEAGRLAYKPDGKSQFLIQVNQADSEQRQAFSACHEMGHLLMPNYDMFRGCRTDWDTMRWNPKTEEEHLCNVVAAQLLMPRRLLRVRLRGEGMGIAVVEPLCEEFGTSQEATIFNIVRAGVEDVAVIYWEWGYRKEQEARAQMLSMFADSDDPMLAPPEKLPRVQRFYSGGTMTDYYFPDNISVDSTSLMARATALFNECGDSAGSHICGPQIIRCKREKIEVKPEFYTESRAYLPKVAQQPRVISFVFPREPQH